LTKCCRPLAVQSTPIRSLRESARNTHSLSSSFLLALSLTSIFFLAGTPLLSMYAIHPLDSFCSLAQSSPSTWYTVISILLPSFLSLLHDSSNHIFFSFPLSISADYTFISASDSLPAHYETQLSSTLLPRERTGVILLRLSLVPSLVSPAHLVCHSRTKTLAFVDISTPWLFPPNILLHGTS